MRGFIKFLIKTKKYTALLGLGIVLFFFAAAALAPLIYSWEEITYVNLMSALEAPSLSHILGTDEMGRDMLGRIIWGARISIIVAVLSVGLALVAGVLIGGICGFYDGPASFVVMRGMDALISFPRLLLAIMLIAVLGTGVLSLSLAIGISSIPVFARLFRGPVLSLKTRDYVAASVSLGASDARLLFLHILPSTYSVMIVQGSISLAEAILIASGLSFLGLGPQPPIPEWGAMIAGSRAHMVSNPHVVLAPGIALFVVILAFNVLGDGLRDFFDPKSRRTSSARSK